MHPSFTIDQSIKKYDIVHPTLAKRGAKWLVKIEGEHGIGPEVNRVIYDTCVEIGGEVVKFRRENEGKIDRRYAGSTDYKIGCVFFVQHRSYMIAQAALPALKQIYGESETNLVSRRCIY